MKLRFVIGDMPARHTMKGLVSHTGRYGCEVCHAEARTHPIRWPYQSTMGASLRTRETIEEALRYNLFLYLKGAFPVPSK